MTRLMGNVCRLDQRFRWHTAGHQTVAAHIVSFDQCRPRAEHRRTTRRNQTGGARTDRNHVIDFAGWFGGPVAGVNVVAKFAIVFVRWIQNVFVGHVFYF